MGSAGAASWFATKTWATEVVEEKSSRKTSWQSSHTLSAAITGAVQQRIAADELAKGKRRQQQQRQREKKEEKMRLTSEQQEAGRLRREAKAARRKEAEGTVARRVRVFPNAAQRTLLRKAFEACRYVYNRGAEIANSTKVCGKRLQKEIRDTFTSAEAWKRTSATVDPEWACIPYEVRDSAVRDLAKAAESSDALMEAKAVDKGGGTDVRTGSWSFKFRRKKDVRESLCLRCRDLNRKKGGNKWFAQLFGTLGDRSAMRSSQQGLPAEFANDVRLVHDKVLGTYHLIIPMQSPTVNWGDSQAPSLAPSVDCDGDVEMASAVPLRVLAIDPGVRTFATCYDPDGLAAKWGCGPTNARLWRLANTMNGVRARMARPDVSHRSRRRMRRAAARIAKRIRDMVDELHHKFARWACTNYDAVLLPKFEVQGMVGRRKNKRRRITRKCVSRMYTLAHYRFRQFIAHKAKQLGSSLFLVSEAYTTKTCGACGLMHEVGGSETFRCPACGAVADRDINAARNILIKFLHDGDGPHTHTHTLPERKKKSRPADGLRRRPAIG